jgi:hypothetical protein
MTVEGDDLLQIGDSALDLRDLFGVEDVAMMFEVQDRRLKSLDVAVSGLEDT